MSQLDSKTREIGGHKFEVYKLDPLDAQDVLIDIGQALAPALGRAAKALGVDGENLLDLDVEDPRISSSIASLAQSVTKERMRALIKTMAEVTTVDGNKLPVVMPVVFRGDLPLMYQWLWFALTVNFGNFTAWAGDAIKGVSGRTMASLSQPTLGDIGQR